MMCIVRCDLVVRSTAHTYIHTFISPSALLTPVVGIVCFVVHDEFVVHEIEAV